MPGLIVVSLYLPRPSMDHCLLAWALDPSFGKAFAYLASAGFLVGHDDLNRTVGALLQSDTHIGGSIPRVHALDYAGLAFS